MTELGSLWPETPLAELLTERAEPMAASAASLSGLRMVEKISFATGAITFRAHSQSKTGLIRIRPGDLVVSNINAAKGAIALYPESAGDDLSATIHYSAYSANRRRAATEYLWWLLRSRLFRHLLVAQLPGGIKTELAAKRLLRVRVPMPPLEEQIRRLRRLRKIAETGSALKELRLDNSRRREAVLEAMYKRWFSPSDGAWLPLSTFVDRVENGWSPQCRSEPAAVSEWGVLKIGAVSTGTFKPHENKALPAHLPPRPSLQVRSGDILMVRANTTELTGRCAVVAETRPRLMLCDKLFRIHFKTPSLLDPDYFLHAMESSAVRQQIEDLVSGTSGSMKNISKEKVFLLRIPYRPLADQKRIADKLGRVRKVIGKIRAEEMSAQRSGDALGESAMVELLS